MIKGENMILMKTAVTIVLFTNVISVHAAHFGKFSMRSFTSSKDSISVPEQKFTANKPSVHHSITTINDHLNTVISKKPYGSLWKNHKEIGNVFSRINNKDFGASLEQDKKHLKNLTDTFKENLKQINLTGEICSIARLETENDCCCQKLLLSVEDHYCHGCYEIVEERLERVIYCIYRVKKDEYKEIEEIMASLAKIKEFIEKNP